MKEIRNEKHRNAYDSCIPWELFLQTGQVRDYLQYRRQEQEGNNPRRRMVNSSMHKNFY